MGKSYIGNNVSAFIGDNFFIVVMDDDGTIRPLAGIWRLNDAGIKSKDEYTKKNKGAKFCVCELKKKQIF